MYCGKCGRELKDGEICGCQGGKIPARSGEMKEAAPYGMQNRPRVVQTQRAQMQRPPEMQAGYERKSGWNVFLTLSIVCSVLSIVVFVLMRFLVSAAPEAGKMKIMLTYAVPAVMDVFACLMAIISFKDKHLWIKSLLVFLAGIFFGIIFSVSLVIFPQSRTAEAPESDAQTEEEMPESPESAGLDGSSEVSRIDTDYMAGRLGYAEAKKALEELDADSLGGADAELVKKLEDDLEETIQLYTDANQYAEAYEELSEVLAELPNDAAALALQESCSESCFQYLKEESEALLKEGEEEEARELLEEAKGYYPDAGEIDGLIENLDEMSVLERDYIIPDSDSRYLTDADIEGLSLREINYAKNEIYARRGRKFDSKELQEYFNGKDWYSGTIEPLKFNDSVFNKYERANAVFLSKAEFALDSRGYQLDQ